jgi:hypothetical protein
MFYISKEDILDYLKDPKNGNSSDRIVSLIKTAPHCLDQILTVALDGRVFPTSTFTHKSYWDALAALPPVSEASPVPAGSIVAFGSKYYSHTDQRSFALNFGGEVTRKPAKAQYYFLSDKEELAIAAAKDPAIILGMSYSSDSIYNQKEIGIVSSTAFIPLVESFIENLYNPTTSRFLNIIKSLNNYGLTERVLDSLAYVYRFHFIGLDYAVQKSAPGLDQNFSASDYSGYRFSATVPYRIYFYSKNNRVTTYQAALAQNSSSLNYCCSYNSFLASLNINTIVDIYNSLSWPSDSSFESYFSNILNTNSSSCVHFKSDDFYILRKNFKDLIHQPTALIGYLKANPKIIIKPVAAFSNTINSVSMQVDNSNLDMLAPNIYSDNRSNCDLAINVITGMSIPSIKDYKKALINTKSDNPDISLESATIDLYILDLIMDMIVNNQSHKDLIKVSTSVEKWIKRTTDYYFNELGAVKRYTNGSSTENPYFITFSDLPSIFPFEALTTQIDNLPIDDRNDLYANLRHLDSAWAVYFKPFTKDMKRYWQSFAVASPSMFNRIHMKFITEYEAICAKSSLTTEDTRRKVWYEVWLRHWNRYYLNRAFICPEKPFGFDPYLHFAKNQKPISSIYFDQAYVDKHFSWYSQMYQELLTLTDKHPSFLFKLWYLAWYRYVNTNAAHHILDGKAIFQAEIYQQWALYNYNLKDIPAFNDMSCAGVTHIKQILSSLISDFKSLR